MFQNLSPSNKLAEVSEIEQPSALNESNFHRNASNNNEILEDQNQQVSSTPSKQVSDSIQFEKISETNDGYNNEILEDQKQQESANSTVQLSSQNKAIPVLQRGNKENDFSDFVQDPPAATVSEVFNPNHKGSGTIGSKQLQDLLDKYNKKLDDKMNPVINSLAQQKETLRKLSKPTNSAPVIGDCSLIKQNNTISLILQMIILLRRNN